MNLPLPTQPINRYLIIRTHPVRRVVGTAHSESEAAKSVRMLESCPSLQGAKYEYKLNPAI